jgi:hypothetical protein
VSTDYEINGMKLRKGAVIRSGSTAPEVFITDDISVGSLYLRTDGTLYRKTSAGVTAGSWTLTETAVQVQEEGSNVGGTSATFNFVGSGITATDVGGVATITVPGSEINEYFFTAIEGQTVFTGADDDANTLAISGVPVVMSNGVVLERTTDYTFTGTTLTLVAGVPVNTEINITDYAMSVGNTGGGTLQYEEGTFTPGYNPTTGAFTAINYAVHTVGNYTRIGNVVNVSGRIRTDSLTVGTAAGALFIDGLPYATSSAVSNLIYSPTVGRVAAFTGEHPTNLFLGVGVSQIQLTYRTSVTGNTLTTSDVTDMTTGAGNDVTFAFSYQTDDAFTNPTTIGGTGGGRTYLTADKTYYVRTNGSDANNGAANTAGGAWLTLQYAVNWLSRNVDGGGYTITLSVGTGTYTENCSISAIVGCKRLVLQGEDLDLNSTVIYGVSSTMSMPITVSYMKLTGGTYGVLANGPGTEIVVDNVEFGTATTAHIQLAQGGSVLIDEVTVSDDAPKFIAAREMGRTQFIGTATVTLTGTPNFSSAFVDAQRMSYTQFSNVTFVGTATGKRYSGADNSVIWTNTADTTFLPGNSAGTLTNGAVYS